MGPSTFKGFTNLLIDDGGTKLYANCMDNKIYCYNLSSYSPKPYKKYLGLRNNTFYIKSCLSPDGNYLISGSSDEKAYIWNLKKSKTLPFLALNGHTVEVTCVAWSGASETCIVTCSDDARHKIWRIGPEKIDDYDDELYYKGNAGYYQLNKEKKYNHLFTSLDELNEEEGGCTPRSMRNFVAKNEKTPCSSKRTFSEMNDDDNNNNGNKRPITGRTLFTPSSSSSLASTSTSYQKQSNGNDDGVAFLDVKNVYLGGGDDDDCSPNILLENNSPKNFVKLIESSSTSFVMNNILPPLFEEAEEISYETLIPSPQPSASNVSNLQQEQQDQEPQQQQQQQQNQLPSTSSELMFSKSSPSIAFSPTSNLPNYVLDGEAPHLHIMSPKRTKNKDNVDWLTRIRKRKLSTNGRVNTLKEKLSCTETETTTITTSSSTPVTLSSPSSTLNNLRFSHEYNGNSNINNNGGRIKNNIHGNPKSRISSRSGSTDHYYHHHKSGNNTPSSSQTTPTARRRNSETSILRYLTVTSPLSLRPKQQQSQQQQN